METKSKFPDYNWIKATGGSELRYEGELEKLTLSTWSSKTSKKTYFTASRSLYHPFLVFYEEKLGGDLIALGYFTKDMFDFLCKHPRCEDIGSLSRSISWKDLKVMAIKESMDNDFSKKTK